MKRRPSSAGFSFIEVVVVIGVLGGLAAIVIPVVGKFVEDAQKVRAKEDCEMIAQALERFYQDVGMWPTFGSTGMPEQVYSLVSGESVITASPYGFKLPTGELEPVTYHLKWMTGGSSNTARADTLSNHLITNTPKGQSTYVYPTDKKAQFCWRGPYLRPVGMDPWGHPYVVTLVAPAAHRVSDANGDLYSYSRWVVSAGPNGSIHSVWHPTARSDQRRNNLVGDDIGSRIDAETD